MEPYFNISGPCIPGRHYMLPPERRLSKVRELIDGGRYFAFYSSWQMGKTTCAKWLVENYNAGDRCAALWVDLETAREDPDPHSAMPTILENLDLALRRDLGTLSPPSWSPEENPSLALLNYLQELCRRMPQPLVVFFDEADGLVGRSMVSFLTQLRQGYLDRDKVPFPVSVVLVGRRQVRDFVLTQQDRRPIKWLGSSSPFNITVEAATLGPFTEEEAGELLAQHTAATGQAFAPDAVARIYYLSQGHPWLVNALADQIVRLDVRDRNVTITAAHVDSAKDTIIQERRTHIDSLSPGPCPAEQAPADPGPEGPRPEEVAPLLQLEAHGDVDGDADLADGQGVCGSGFRSGGLIVYTVQNGGRPTPEPMFRPSH